MARWFRTFSIAWWIAVLAVAGWHLVHYGIEARRIDALAAEIAAGVTAPRDVATRMMERVRARVALTDKGVHFDAANRPTLGQTAWETWSWGEGRDGEGARLLVNLLQARGVPASPVEVVDARSGAVRTCVAYEVGDEWRLLNSVDDGGAFHRWTLDNERPLGALVAARPDAHGGLVVTPDNPHVTRYSFFAWSRAFDGGVEINQLRPFPQWIVHLSENPPLLVALATLAGGSVVWLLGLGLARRQAAAERRHLAMGLRSA